MVFTEERGWRIKARKTRHDAKSEEMGDVNYGGDGGVATSKREVATTQTVLINFLGEVCSIKSESL